MYKIRFIVFIICFFILKVSANTSTSYNTTTHIFTYDNPNCKISFNVPENYTPDEINITDSNIVAKFMFNNNMILLSYNDIYDNFSESEKKLIERSSVSNDIYTISDIEEQLQLDSGSVYKQNFADIPYFVCKMGSTYKLLNLYDFRQYIIINNGVMYILQYFSELNDTNYQDIESLLSTVTISNQNYNNPITNFDVLLKDIVISFSYLCLPWIIYRDIIHKKPISIKQAKKIIIIYSIIIFTFRVLFGLIFTYMNIQTMTPKFTAILFYGIISVRILSKDKSYNDT